jgi:hypothetical protein
LIMRGSLQFCVSFLLLHFEHRKPLSFLLPYYCRGSGFDLQLVEALSS